MGRVMRYMRGGLFALFLVGGLVSCNTGATGGAGAGAVQASHRARLQPSETLELSGLQEQFQAVADKASPAVVAISASDAPPRPDEATSADALNPDKLSDLFDSVDRTVGTGFVIDPDGYIVTNDHV